MTVQIFFRMCDGQLPVLPVVNHKAKFFDPGLLDGRCTHVCPTFVRNFDSELADTSTACYFTTLSLVHVHDKLLSKANLLGMFSQDLVQSISLHAILKLETLCKLV